MLEGIYMAATATTGSSRSFLHTIIIIGARSQSYVVPAPTEPSAAIIRPMKGRIIL